MHLVSYLDPTVRDAVRRLEHSRSQIVVGPLLSQATRAKATRLSIVLPLVAADALSAPKSSLGIVLGLDSLESGVVGSVHGALPVWLVTVTLQSVRQGGK
jgi:hypothetical protein